LAGEGSFVTHSPTRQTKTNVEVIARFLPARIKLGEMSRDVWRVEVESQKDGDIPPNGFFPCFSWKKRNNSTDRHVMSMEIAMRQWLSSSKPASHEVTRRHEALGQFVINMRDYTRI